MSELIKQSENEPNKEDYPTYYIILELDSLKPAKFPLIIGQRSKKNPKYNPDIDLIDFLGIFESDLAQRQLFVDVSNRTIKLTETATQETLHNGKRLERGEIVDFSDNDLINIGKIQLFIQFVDTTNTGKPYYLNNICSRIPTYIPIDHRLKTPWNPEGYSPREMALDGTVPLWMTRSAQIEASTWELDFDEVLNVIIESEKIDREKESKRKQGENYPHLKESRIRISKMLHEQRINERIEQALQWGRELNGEWVGICGHLTGSGAVQYPVYRQEDGRHFISLGDIDSVYIYEGNIDEYIKVQEEISRKCREEGKKRIIIKNPPENYEERNKNIIRFIDPEDIFGRKMQTIEEWLK